MSASDEALRERQGELPYGVWLCEDGRVVLFNRRYEPIYERPAEGGPVRPADRTEWICARKYRRYFYGNGHYEHEKRRRAKAALDEFMAGGTPSGDRPPLDPVELARVEGKPEAMARLLKGGSK